MKGFVSRNGRILKKGQLVGVHWNSHKEVYSIVEFKSRNTAGLVIGYASSVTLINCTVKIDSSKQKTVREKNRKDRHAFIVGYVEDINQKKELTKKIYYNPYKVDSFVDKDLFEKGEVKPLSRLKRVHMNSNFQNNKPYVTYE